MLSRVQEINQVFIVNSFNESKIRTSQKALEELKRLENISINKNPSSWEKSNNESIKVATLNCAGLKPHIKDIEADDKIKQGDIIHLI